MKWTFILLGMLLPALMAGQKFTVSGYVSDKESGELLIGASIYEKTLLKGTSANLYGFYSLTLEADSLELIFSYAGYEPIKKVFKLDADIIINVQLASINELGEVEIIASQSTPIQDRTQMSSIELSMQKVKSLPVLMGERDVLKTIQLMPGVQSGSEGSSGIYVRGGGPDQNLILLDGVPIYNVSHLFGFFSVFNPDAIKAVELIKGGFPARYGGRLSSVLDIRMKEGNMNKISGEGSIGLVASKLTLEGPIKKGQTSFLVSGRRTYLDLLIRPFVRAESNGDATGGYYFYDFNAKINHKLDDKNRLYLSGYFGKDRAFTRFDDGAVFGGGEEKEVAELEWGNIIGALRWNRELSSQLFANTTFTYSRYKFKTGIEYTYKDDDDEEKFLFEYTSGIEDLALKIDLDHLPNPDHYLKYGAGATYHNFTPGVNFYEFSGTDITAIDTTWGSSQIQSIELYAFAEDDWKVNELLKLNIGLHGSSFHVDGTSYFSIQPRISARYLLNEKWSVKSSYSAMAQYLHLLTNTSIGLPTDLWVPVTENIKPLNSHQVALGVATSFHEQFELSIEGYYKVMNNIIEYKDGASFLADARDWQTKVETGKGWSYGAEILLEKTVGKFSGWIGYTLSWTERQFDNLNFGEKFPYRYDRRHDIGIALTYKPKERIDFGLVWVYGTGNAVSIPSSTYLSDGSLPHFNDYYVNSVEYISDRNGYRMPSYHRLDFAVNLHKQKNGYKRTWSWGVYNMYSRQNPFYLYFANDDDGDPGLFQVSLFPIIPYFSYQFKF